MKNMVLLIVNIFAVLYFVPILSHSCASETSEFYQEPQARNTYWWSFDRTPPYSTVPDPFSSTVIRLRVGDFETPIDTSVIPVPMIAPQLNKEDYRYYILQFTGHEGLEFRVDEKAEEWYRISLPNGIKGWIPVESVEIV